MSAEEARRLARRADALRVSIARLREGAKTWHAQGHPEVAKGQRELATRKARELREVLEQLEKVSG